MKPRPLRQLLSRQTLFILLLPFFFLALVGLVWFLPSFEANIETHQIHLSHIITLKTENHLIKSMTLLEGISSLIKEPGIDSSTYQKILRSQVLTSGFLKAVYIIGPQGKTIGVSLRSGNEHQEKDLMRLDLSENPLFKKVVHQKQTAWSNSFLSIIGGGISVALAIPSGQNIVMGEIDLGELTDHLEQIATIGEQLILVLDQRGQVIADQKGYYTAQQMNLSHIPLIKQGMQQRQAVIGDLNLDGKMMTGCVVKASLVDWLIVTATPKSIANRPLWTTALLLCLILTGTLITGILLSVLLARKLAFRFENLAQHARKIAQGKNRPDWPSFNITEFNDLAADIQDMADTIQEREAYNRVLFADSPIPLGVIHPETALFIDVNRAALRILGESSQETLKGRSLLDFSPSCQQNGFASAMAFRDHVNESLSNGFTTFEWQFQRYANEVWFGEIFLSGFSHGGMGFLQMSIHDITLRKSEEAKGKRLEEQLRQAQKMESIGTLAGGIAHDFNNILVPVMGYTEMILADLPKESPLQFPMEQVLKGSLRAKDLVEQILLFSRRTHKELKPLQINLIIREILKLSRATLPATIEIRQNILSQTGLVLADPTQIHQVVMNLITNAFHAMETQGGILTIELEAVQIFPQALPIPDLMPGSYICLTVSDTGVGMTYQTKEQIFDPYFTTKEKGKGTGLGLAVVHGIVKSYQGDILVESEKGKGTTFKVYLPRIVSMEPSQTEIIPRVTPKGSGHVLVVDDEKEISVMMEQMLESFGYRVSSFNRSLDALAAFAASPDKFDLVITDMTMPDLTGDQLAEKIKTIKPDVPIILCTGFSQKVTPGETGQVPVDTVLMKPILREDLAQAITRFFRKNKT